MSKISIEGNASGTGTLTIAAPNTNTNYSLSLPEEAGTITTSNSPYSTFRNRIINGDMRIDQRNAGASVTVTAGSNNFSVDRYELSNATDGQASIQQDSSAPTGFVNSVKVTTTTADGTLATTQNLQFYQKIEGTNVSDLAWGTANAKTVTLSFWVRSSLTGTFGGSFRNSAVNRSYPFTYSISVADTWEYKTITVAGDTSGTWLTTTGIGLWVTFGLGVGPDRSGTAGSWAGANYISATGAVSVIGTLNATWYITGVQLEVGSVATPFERIDYGRQLIQCQRYYWKLFPNDTSRLFGSGQCFTTAIAGVQIPFQVQMRTRPTALEQSGTASHYKMLNAAGGDVACSAVPAYSAATTDYIAWVVLTVASGLSAGNGTTCLTNNAAAYLAWSAEL